LPWSRDAGPARPTTGAAGSIDEHPHVGRAGGTAEPDAGSLRDGSSSLNAEEKAALDAYRNGLLAEGWVEDEQGNLWQPESEA
jgi:hypothetical protein